MKRNKLVVKRNWVIVNKTYHLLVEVEGKTYHKKFRIYKKDGAESIIKVNKQLKEYDLVEQLRRECGVRKVEFT